MTDTGSYETGRRPKTDLIPWILFVAVALLLGSTAIVLGLRLRQANDRVESEYLLRADAEQHRLAAEQLAKAAQARAAALEAQLREATAQRDATAATPRAVEEVARPAPAVKAPAKAVVKKKGVPKRRHR